MAITLSSINDVQSPCFIIDKTVLISNLKVLHDVKQKCGINILHAQKAFASYAVYPEIQKYLDGVCSSGLYETRLGDEFFKGNVHTYSPAYRDDEIDDIFNLSHTVTFNSISQLEHFKTKINSCRNSTQIGLRINPECSVTTTPLYDPCSNQSRLGVRPNQLNQIPIEQIDGLHFHALCEQDSYALEKVLHATEEKFGSLFNSIKWINMGGGHFITQKQYDKEHFIALITQFKNRHPHLEVYIEPGGAIVLNAGVLLAEVLDVLNSPNGQMAILDISCTCHTPDVLEMPYKPSIINEVPQEDAPYIYQLGGVSCLAGDVFGTYGFNKPLTRGDKLIFNDMAQYSIVKTTMFNGVRHPSIAVLDETGKVTIVNQFGFDDFKRRL